jgi:hypothetical protein
MFTEIINDKRECLFPDLYISAWDYLKSILDECGFCCEQSASSKEYVMKGCDNLILIYVKFNTNTESKIVFVSQNDQHQSIKVDWSDREQFHINGDFVLFNIRHLWSKMSKPTTHDE